MEVLIDIAVLATVAGIAYAAGWWDRRHIAYEIHLDAVTEVKVVHS
jgi:hypothetical protein